MSIFAAIGASLLFESPFIGLEKLLFGRGGGGRQGRKGQTSSPNLKHNGDAQPNDEKTFGVAKESVA